MSKKQPCEGDLLELEWLRGAQSADKRYKKLYNQNQCREILDLKRLVEALKDDLKVVEKENKEHKTKFTATKDEYNKTINTLVTLNSNLQKEFELVRSKSVEMFRRYDEKLSLNETELSKMKADHEIKLAEIELMHEQVVDKLVSNHKNEMEHQETKLQCLIQKHNESILEKNVLQGKEATLKSEMVELQADRDNLRIQIAQSQNEMYFLRVENSERKVRRRDVATLKREAELTARTLNNSELEIESLKEELKKGKEREEELEKGKEREEELKKGKEHVVEELCLHALLKMKSTMGKEENNTPKELKIQLDPKDKDSEKLEKSEKKTINNRAEFQSQNLKLEKELCKERERCKKLVAYQQHFKMELLKCTDLISDTERFKRSVIDLKIKFTDDDDYMVLKRIEHERKFINGLQNKYKKVIDVKSREVLVERGRFCKKCLEVSDNTQELNEKTVLIRKLHEQIKETKQTGWFTRKGAARNKVYPLASMETTPSKPMLLDGYDTPSAPFCLKRMEPERKMFHVLQNKDKKLLAERRPLHAKCVEVGGNTKTINEPFLQIRKLEQTKETHGPEIELPNTPVGKVKWWFTRKGAAGRKVYLPASMETTPSKPTLLRPAHASASASLSQRAPFNSWF
ncbi:uncharacterized protein LOC144382921 [Gasterosteus aculeatus]